MFTVTADEGFSLDLALQDATSGTQATYSGFGMEHSIDGGTNWTTYSGSAKPTVPASGKVYVRVNISSEADAPFEGTEKFALKSSYTTNTSITDAADNSIIDDGTGTKYTGAISSGLPVGNTTSLDDDRAISISASGPVNEGSTYAMFTVTAEAGYELDLNLQDATSGTFADYNGFSFKYSTDGGSTWTTYSSTSKPTVPSGGKVYVQVDISSEADTKFEGSETFALKASYTNNTTKNAAADNSIIDDGTGTKYDGTVSSGTPGSNTSSLDDDRKVNVTTFGPVNEGSTYAIFSVSAEAGYSLDLAIQDATTGTAATHSGFSFEYSTDGGSNWTTYNSSSKPTVPSSGTVNVRVNVSSEADTTYEGAETFALKASYTTNTTITDAENNTIIDDGTGTKYGGTITSGTPGSNTTSLDDDRPSFAIDDVTRNEGAGTITFTVTKTGTTNLASTVSYKTADGTADAGTSTANDYVAAEGTLTFANTDTTKTITTSIWNDARYEVSENFKVDLSSASHATISDAQGIGTIKDDGTGGGATDNDVSAIDIRSYTPVNEGSSYAVFVVEGTASQTVTLTLANVTTELDLGTATIETSSDGTTWTTYSTGSKPTMPGSTKLFVRVGITSEQETAFENSESFTLTATNASNSAVTATAKTIIVDNGTGIKYGPNFTSGAPAESTTSLDDDRTLAVTPYGPVNEASTYAMFKVTSLPGYEINLSTTNGTATLSSPAIEYSLDGANWVTYDSTHKPKVDGSGTTAGDFYVRVNITSEQDSVYEVSETFSLVTAYANNTSKTASGQTSIVDAANGKKYGPKVTSGTPEESTTDLDDDRPLSVTAYGPINENSLYGMFTVTAYQNFQLDLNVLNGSATLVGAQIDYSTDGTNWTTYGAGNKPTVPANGKVYVRVDVTSEDDYPYEGPETFSLVTNYSDNTSRLVNGQTTIIDDGTGRKYGPNMPSGTPATSTSGLDNDIGNPPIVSDDKPPIRVYEPITLSGSEDAFVLAAVKEAREALDANELADTMESDAQAIINKLSGDVASHVLSAVSEARATTIATFNRIFGDGSNSFVTPGVGENSLFSNQPISFNAGPATAGIFGETVGEQDAAQPVDENLIEEEEEEEEETDLPATGDGAALESDTSEPHQAFSEQIRLAETKSSLRERARVTAGALNQVQQQAHENSYIAV